ncbi:MAG: carbohydrate ABC transporter permease [Eubacteriales bacterium]|nr:carbohydrate ABC transporter permease [Eubacteriales bacterium]
MALRKRMSKSLLVLALALCLFAVLIPFYIIVVNSFKPYAEIAKNIFTWPGQNFTLENYSNAWRRLNFANSLKNTAFISIFSNIGGVVFCSMTGYWITRHPNWFTRACFYIIISFMSIPFQALMIPFARLTNTLNLSNSLPGITVCFWAMTVSLSTFIISGAVKSIPAEIESAALIDGCGSFVTFWRIVFPQIKASVFTVATINTLWFWNDYLMTQLVLSKNSLRTIQIAMQALFNEAFFAWDVALAALTLSILPLFVFFIIAQKQVLAGVSAGAVKG